LNLLPLAYATDGTTEPDADIERHWKPPIKMSESPSSTTVKPLGTRHEDAFVGTLGFAGLSGCSLVFG
jgi:hypothetical protein